MARIAMLTSVFFQRLAENGGQDRIIFGGAERYTVELNRLLQDLGHQVVLYQSHMGEGIIRRNYEGMEIRCLPVKDAWDLHVAPNLNRVFNEMAVGADLRIYIAPFLCWPRVVSPCISISHGVYWDTPDSIVRAASTTEKWRFFERNFYGMTGSDLCVSCDTNTRGVLAAIQPGEERKVMYIPNFVDTKKFKPKNRKPGECKVRVLYPRRLQPIRGINDFIEAAQMLPEYDFVMVGQSYNADTDQHVASLQKDVPNLQTTWRPMDKMAEVYQDADIAVIPTRACEGTSLSCLEAMATGLPVIATPAGGLPNLVVDRYNGLLVDTNHDRLTPAIKMLAENPELRQRLGVNGRQMAVESFSLTLWRERWTEAISRVLR